MRNFILFFMLLAFVGCGYAPVARVADEVIDGPVFVEVAMSKVDPQNTVAINDAVREGVVYRLHQSLGSREIAKTKILVSINSLKFSAITYDQFGYATSYRADLSLGFRVSLSDGRVLNLSGSGDHDFRVSRLVKSARDTSSIISDQERYTAIQNASSQAFDEFIAALAVQSLKGEKGKNKKDKTK